jgi:hypothetical protein
LLAACVFARGEPATVTFYDKDPLHVWNRLYVALLVPGPDGKSLPADILDAPNAAVEQLKSEPGHSAVVTMLREFVKSGPPPNTMSPLQRAVMQRDLLGMFHIQAFRMPPGTPWTASQKELLSALARGIRHVALTEEEIKKLPDNYAAAVGAPGAVTVYDSAKPGPFLPPDLLNDDGPWIGLGTNRETTATNGSVAHAHFAAFYGRTSFEVRMRHPEGRAAGVAYLKSLEEMKEPFVRTAPKSGELISEGVRPADERGPRWFNADTPQFPVGTMWALVRRSLLADTTGKIVATPLVESVQMRVYRALHNRAILESAAYKSEIAMLQASGKDFDYTEVLGRHYQTVFEWEMRRGRLLEGKGGFHLTTPEDLRFAHFFPMDGSLTINRFCTMCHMGPNILSVNSRSGQFRQLPMNRPPDLVPFSRAYIDSTTVSFASKLPAWVLLEWLWADQP